MSFKTTQVALPNGETVELRELADGTGSVCPVCGFISQAEPAWSMGRAMDEKTGQEYGPLLAYPSYDICPVCDTQYGLDDIFADDRNPPMPGIWERLRVHWLDRVGWNEQAIHQLRQNLGIDIDALKQKHNRQ